MTNKHRIILIFITVFSEVLSDISKTVKFDKIQECPSEHIIDFSNLTLYMKDRFIMGKGDVVIKKDLHPTFYTKISARRCKENHLNVCETFLNTSIMDFCDRLINPKLNGYRWMSKIRPTLKCPIKADTYSFDSIDIFLGFLLNLPVEGYRWIGKFTGVGKPLREKKGMMTIGCYIINARVMASTSRKRVIKPEDVVLTWA